MDMKTASKLCVLVILCCCITITSAGTRSLENLNCHTRPTVVPTHPLYYPYFVSLHRCNGSCGTNSPARFKCVPSKQKAVEITVHHGLETKVVKLSNHTECTTECVIKEGNCDYPNTYDGKQCTCKCNRNTPPADIHCTPLQSWSKVACGCVCNKMNRSCSSRKYTFDTKTCSCKCNPRRRSRCLEKGGVFSEENCKCRTTLRQISDSTNEGKFIGSTSFWVYVLIGEFVVMLVCFDLILYCKQLGFLYKCTKKCRKERSLEVSDNQNKQTEQTDQTHIQVHWNEGCSRFSSQASLPTVL